MGDTRSTYQTSVGNDSRFFRLFNNGKLSSTRVGRSIYNHKKSNYRNCARLCNAISVALLCSTPVYANTTISSPSSSSQGTVINNGYQTINGNFPTHRFSNGITLQELLHHEPIYMTLQRTAIQASCLIQGVFYMSQNRKE